MPPRDDEAELPASPVCPTPKKKRFATEEGAQRVIDLRGSLGKKLYMYDTCPCGWIHLTSKKSRIDPDAKPVLVPDEKASDDVFARLVRSEVVGHCTPEDAAMLRHPNNLLRWSDELKVFAIDIHKQLNLRVGMKDAGTIAWRKRLAVVQSSLQKRRIEVRGLLRECHASMGRVPTPLMDVPVDIPQSEDLIALREAREIRRLETKDLKRQAGELAVKRLKDAHPNEFVRYLAEEYERADIPVPEKFQKYLEPKTEKET